MSQDLGLRRSIAEELLGHSLDSDGFAPCPGREFHSKTTGRRDFQVSLDGAPTGYCFHSSCSGIVDRFNADLRSRIGKAEASGAKCRPPVMGKVAPKPLPEKKPKRPPYSPEKLRDFAGRCPHPVTPEWLRARSPIDILGAGSSLPAEAFLAALYHPGERVLVFTSEFSQGDFLYAPELGSFRLADRPGVRATPSPLPDGGPAGVWFLAQPVSGEWMPNLNNRDGSGAPRMGRRHGSCVTSWRFLVLESDEAPAELWLRALVQLPLPIVAIYTSGGRSVHALARVDAGSKPEWDALRDDLVQNLCPLGADPAAMTAVRLTRLPGCLRHGTRGKDGRAVRYPKPQPQELLYLAPGATARTILDR